MTTQTALITGASNGPGKALAESLASEAWELIITTRGKHWLRDVRADLRDHTRVMPVSGDNKDPDHHAWN